MVAELAVVRMETGVETEVMAVGTQSLASLSSCVSSAFFFQGHVLAILFSIVMYNRLQARQRREQLADIEAQLAVQHSPDQLEAMFDLGDDLPPIQLQDEGASHSQQKAETGGPLSRLAAALPWTRKSKLRYALSAKTEMTA